MESATVDLGELRRLGLAVYKEQEAQGLDLATLRRLPPGLVIAEACCDFSFGDNNLKRKGRYLINAAAYEALNESGRRQRGKPVLKPASIQFAKIYRPYQGQDLAARTILFLRAGGCGDIIFINPLLRYLKEHWPTCRIKFATGAPYQSMVSAWPWVDEVCSMPLTVGQLLEADYHAVFEGVIERTRDAEEINAYELFARWLGLDIPLQELRPLQAVDPALRKEARGRLTTWGLEGDDFILVQMRASSPVRTPNMAFWRRLLLPLREAGFKLVMADEPRFAPAIDKLLADWGSPAGVFNAAPFSKSFLQALAWTSLSRLVLATDSALLHLGASVGKKVFGIYGPFPGRVRLSTYPMAAWMDAPAECAPCFTHGHAPCPHVANQCFNNLDQAALVAAIGDLYAR